MVRIKRSFLLTFSVQLSLVLWISLIHRFFGLQQKHSSRRIKASFFMPFHGLAIGLLLMYIIQSFCKYYVSYQGHMMGANMERDMRQQLFDHYEELSFSYYSQNNSGQMMSKLVSDLFDISEFAHHGPENLFISLVKIIGAFIFLFFINKKTCSAFDSACNYDVSLLFSSES